MRAGACSTSGSRAMPSIDSRQSGLGPATRNSAGAACPAHRTFTSSRCTTSHSPSSSVERLDRDRALAVHLHAPLADELGEQLLGVLERDADLLSHAAHH